MEGMRRAPGLLLSRANLTQPPHVASRGKKTPLPHTQETTRRDQAKAGTTNAAVWSKAE